MRRRISLPLACWLALALAAGGCASKPAPVPDPSLPQAFGGQPAQARSVVELGWRDFFTDPDLQALIARALVANRDLHLATARLAEARAGWRMAGAALYPQLAGMASATRQRMLYPAAGGGSAYLGLEQYTAQLSAGWELDFWGRLSRLDAAARARYLATAEARRAVAADVVAQVALGWLLEREYQERTAIAQHTLTSRAETLRIMRRRFEVGSGSKLEVAQAEILLDQARTAMAELEQDRQVNLNGLILLVGGGPVQVAAGPLGLGGRAEGADVPVGLPSDLLVNRPDIVAAEQRLIAAHADVGAARAAFFPTIQLTGAYGTASDALGSLFAPGTQAWSFAPSLTMPLFNAGQLKSSLDIAKARREQAVADYEATVQRAFRDVSDALVRHRQIGLQIEATRATRDAQAERARLAQLRYDAGSAAYLEVLDAQRGLFDSEQALVRLRGAQLASAVAMYQAVGGGSDALAAGSEDGVRK